MTLNELHKYIQEFHRVEDLGNAWSEIFNTKEASPENIREKKGPHGRLFKLAGEELGPLIEWMEIYHQDREGRVIDGNQSFDAEVRRPDTGAVIRLEIGFATDGYQEALRAEQLSRDGRAGAFHDLKRVQRDKSADVGINKKKDTKSRSEIVEELLENLKRLAEKKAEKEKYEPPLALLLFLDNRLPLSSRGLDGLKAGAEEILRRHDWVFDKVDVLCARHGLIASWTKSGRHSGA